MRKVALTATAVLGTLALTAVSACGSAQSSGSAAKSQPPASQKAAAAPVTVTLWSWTPVAPTMKQIVADIEKKYPNIRIQTNIEPTPDYRTALKAAAASGSLPDIVGLAAGSLTQEYRADLQPLDAVANKLWGSGWQSNFPQAALNQARLGNPAGDSHYYMLPQEVEVLNLWYNKKIFSQLHLKPPTSFAQLVSDSHAITKAGDIGFYFGAGQSNFLDWQYLEMAAQTDFSAMEASAKGTNPQWNAPGMIQAARYFKQLFTDNVVQPGALGDVQYPTGANLFAAGKVGMILLGSWWLQESQFASSPPGLKTMQDYGTFAFPPLAAGLSATPPLGGVDFGWGLTKNAARSPQVEQACELVLKELISGVGEQVSLNQMNDLPAFKGMQPTISLNSHILALYHRYLQQIKIAHNHQIGNPAVAQALFSNLQALAAGKESATQAMNAVQAAATK